MSHEVPAANKRKWSCNKQTTTKQKTKNKCKKGGGGVEGLEETKEKKGVSGDGRVTHPVQKHSVSKLSIKHAPLLHTHCCSFLAKSRCTWRNPSNPTKHTVPNVWVYNVWVYMRVREEGKRKNPDVSLPEPLSLPTRLVGCLRVVDVCTLLWLVPDVLHWPKSPRQ